MATQRNHPAGTRFTYRVWQPESGQPMLVLSLLLPFGLRSRTTEHTPKANELWQQIEQYSHQIASVLATQSPGQHAVCELIARASWFASLPDIRVRIGNSSQEVLHLDASQAIPLQDDLYCVRGYPAEGPWPGATSITVTPAQETVPLLQGALPADRVRFFAWQTNTDQHTVFHELHSVFETLYLLPELDCGVALYRAAIPVLTPDGSDIVGIDAVCENPEHPARPLEEHMQESLLQLRAHLANKLNWSMPVPPSVDTLQALPPEELIKVVREQRSRLSDQLSQEGISENELLHTLSQHAETRDLAKILRGTGHSVSGLFETIEALLKDHDAEVADTHPSRLSLPHEHALPTHDPEQPAPVKQTTNIHAQTERTPAVAHPATEPQPAPKPAPNPRAYVMQAHQQGLSCAEADLEGANLAGLNLAGMNFTGANLKNANLAGAHLAGCCFNKACLENALLDGANLQTAQLEDACLDKASLQGANLRNSHMARCSAQAAVLHDADLTQACLNHADLRHARLERANMGLCEMMGAQLQYVQGDQVDLTCANLSTSHANEHTFLRYARLDGAHLTQVTWPGCHLEHATLAGSVAHSADLRHAYLTKAVLVGSNLQYARFDHAQMHAANLNYCDLSYAHLNSADLTGSWMLNSLMEHTDLTDACLVQAHLPENAFLQSTP